MKQSGLDRLFKPHSIAVIGASSDPQKAGHVVIRHLLAVSSRPYTTRSPPQPGHRWQCHYPT
jgi:predicted CoA-binding protein